MRMKKQRTVSCDETRKGRKRRAWIVAGVFALICAIPIAARVVLGSQSRITSLLSNGVIPEAAVLGEGSALYTGQSFSGSVTVALLPAQGVPASASMGAQDDKLVGGQSSSDVSPALEALAGRIRDRFERRWSRSPVTLLDIRGDAVARDASSNSWRTKIPATSEQIRLMFGALPQVPGDRNPAVVIGSSRKMYYIGDVLTDEETLRELLSKLTRERDWTIFSIRQAANKEPQPLNTGGSHGLFNYRLIPRS